MTVRLQAMKASAKPNHTFTTATSNQVDENPLDLTRSSSSNGR